MTENCVGLVAYSKCGRDRKRLFCVVDVLDADFVLIADGKLHKQDRPKKKRLKHLSFTEGRLTLPLCDKELYKRITEFEILADRRDLSAKG